MTITTSPVDEMATLLLRPTAMQTSPTFSPRPSTLKPTSTVLNRIMHDHLFVIELVARAGFILDTLIRYGPTILDIFSGKSNVDGIQETVDEDQRRTFFVRSPSHVALFLQMSS